MKTLQIFDPAMCCSTGVCGPSVDPKLVRLAADVAFLKSKGIEVERYNLAHQPDAFARNATVIAEMGDEAQHLPIFLVDGEMVAKGVYPDRAQLAAWFGLEAEASAEKPRMELRMAGSCGCEGAEEGCC